MRLPIGHVRRLIREELEHSATRLVEAGFFDTLRDVGNSFLNTVKTLGADAIQAVAKLEKEKMNAIETTIGQQLPQLIGTLSQKVLPAIVNIVKQGGITDEAQAAAIAQDLLLTGLTNVMAKNSNTMKQLVNQIQSGEKAAAAEAAQNKQQPQQNNQKSQQGAKPATPPANPAAAPATPAK